MKDIQFFIKKTVYFISALIFTLSILIAFTNFNVKRNILKFISKKEKSNFFLGDSHIQKAIVDSLLPNSANISQSGESFYFTYFKLKKLFSLGININQLFLGFSYHSLSNYYEDFIEGENSKFVAPKYFFLLPNKQKLWVLWSNKNNLGLFVLNIIKKGLNEYNFIGQYKNEFGNTKTNIEITNKRLKLQYANGERDISELNSQYLFKIIQLCKKENIPITFIKTPLSPYYLKQIPNKFVNYYNEKTRNFGIQMVDLQLLNLGDNYFIPDGDHVSREGAIKVTEYLNGVME